MTLWKRCTITGQTESQTIYRRLSSRWRNRRGCHRFWYPQCHRGTGNLGFFRGVPLAVGGLGIAGVLSERPCCPFSSGHGVGVGASASANKFQDFYFPKHCFGIDKLAGVLVQKRPTAPSHFRVAPSVFFVNAKKSTAHR